jgi:anti-sigma factor RsiW
VSCTDIAVGAYALGALEPAERADVERHLRECPACAAEAAEFAGLPPLLALVPPEDLDAEPIEPSPGMFERMAAAAAAEKRAADRTAQRRSTRGRLLIAAVAAAVLAVGGTTVWWASGPSETAHTAVAGAVHLTVTADASSDGTDLDVAVAGVSPGENCRLVVIDQDGVRHQAGSWTASYGGRATFRGWTAVSRAEVRDVVLIGTDGSDLVRVRL